MSTTEVELPHLGLALIGRLPHFAQIALLNDEDFRLALNLPEAGLIGFGEKATFSRPQFFAAVEAAYAGVPEPVEITDRTDVVWTMRVSEEQTADALLLESAGGKMRVRGYFALKPQAGARLEGLHRATAEAGLARDEMLAWETRLQTAPLDFRSLGKLLSDLEMTPLSVEREVEDSAEFEAPALVPTREKYFVRLVGNRVDSLEEFCELNVPALASNLLAWNQSDGRRRAYALASHSRWLSRIVWPAASEEELLSDAKWAQQADLTSKIGFLEFAIPQAVSMVALRPQILRILKAICDLDPSDMNGELALSVSLFTFVEGELSRTKALKDWPPFQRRAATFAHSALLHRVLSERLDGAPFGAWVHRHYHGRMYAVGLTDMRQEPRWEPSLMTPHQLKAELLGRLYNAARRQHDFPKGPLRNFLLGNGKASLSKHLSLASVVAGPLEGSGTDIKLPAEWLAQINKNLEGDVIERSTFAPLINGQAMASVSPEAVAAACALAKRCDYRFSDDVDSGLAEALLAGLAKVAASSRSPELANVTRRMSRIRRRDYPSEWRPETEFITALSAAAAHSDLQDWLDFVGDWLTEIAFEASDAEQARTVAAHLDLLCDVEPRARSVLGRAMCCLDLFIRA